MRNLFILMVSIFSFLYSINVYSEVKDCEVVNIKRVLTGPRHGAMIEVDKVCGNNTWVCLDPDGEFMSKEESKRTFSFVLASKMANKPIRLAVTKDQFAVACNGPFSVINDVRTP